MFRRQPSAVCTFLLRVLRLVLLLVRDAPVAESGRRRREELADIAGAA